MTIRFYNTLSRALEEFQPVDPPNVGVYACGPTVYRAPHIGNFRTFVFNDILHRYLEQKGYTVRFVMNLTDVEDKIIDAALASGGRIEAVTEPMIEAFFADLAALGIRPADAYPRATHHIEDMVRMVERLLERGHAYANDGSIYFDISSFQEYGKLSRIELEETRAGAGLAARAGGIDADEYGKEDARDFALWKGAKDRDHQAGATWQTPWGPGRPGWHIECSAMSIAELGETFDIHTGGEDLVFPHHEDEIAQSEATTGKPFVRYWLHVTHLKVNGEKMSKSKNNDFTISQLLELGHTPAAIRYSLLQAHYRKELNFSFDLLQEGRVNVQRIVDFARRLEETQTQVDAPQSELPDSAAEALTAFEAALDDDLNTPNAFAVLFPYMRKINAELDRFATVRPADLLSAREALARMDAIFGLLDVAKASEKVDDQFARWVEERIAERQDARGRRDFAAADAIRAELAAAGVVVEDTPTGARWKKE